jgi:hypothetical protein
MARCLAVVRFACKAGHQPGRTFGFNPCSSHFRATSRLALTAPGYDLHEIEGGERILPGAIVERFVRRADGVLEPATSESTAPIAETRTHIGICKAKRYAFDMPLT